MNLKKILSALLAAAQLAAISPAVLAAETGTDPAPVFPIVFSPDDFAEKAGTSPTQGDVISSQTAKEHGYTIDPINDIWSLIKWDSASADSVYMPALRFGARTKNNTKRNNINLMKLHFAGDNTKGNPVLDGNGYILETEFAAQMQDVDYFKLNLLGKNPYGYDQPITELRLNASTATTPYTYTGIAAFYDEYRKQDGASVPFKRSADDNERTAAQMLYLKVQVDLVNQKYSAWLAPSKTEKGEHTSVTASDENLLVQDAPFTAANISEFTGISFTANSYTYGNAILLNHVTINPYEPVPESTPAPAAAAEKVRFGVISDIQYGRNNNDSMGPKLKTALEQLKAKAGENELDAIIFGGDMTNNGRIDQYNAVLAIVQEVFPPETSKTKMLFVRGNHDNYEKPANYTAITEAYPYNSSPTTIHEIKGYQFIIVGQDTSGNYSDTVGNLHKQSTIDWLNGTVVNAQKKDPTGERPVFVAMHPHIKDTVYGSRIIDGFRNNKDIKSKYHWGTPDFQEVLEGKSNVITFSGHSHFPITDERSIYQNTYTSLGTGAIAYTEFEQEAWDESFHPQRLSSNDLENVGYYIEVDSQTNQTTVDRLDFYRQEEIKQPWIIENALNENWRQFTDDRDNTAPVFDPAAKPEVKDIGQTTCRVEFRQASDVGSDVHHYKIELVNQATEKTDVAFTPFSYYHMNSQMPESNWWNVTGLAQGTTYVAKITAYDSFSNASKPILSDPFTTVGRIKTPTPIVDIGFTSAGAYDNSVFARANGVTKPITVGTVPVAYNEALNRYEGTFARTDKAADGSAKSNASGNYFKVLMNSARRAQMQTGDGYTLETYFKPTAFKGTDNIIGAAEGGGFDLETTADGKLNVYVRDSSNAWVKTASNGYPGGNTVLPLNEYSHLVVTNNGVTVNVYLNGELIDSAATTPGAIKFPDDADKNDPYYGMVIGGDYTPTQNANKTSYIDQNYAQNAFTGNIIFAKIYDGALNADEVKAEYDAIGERASLAKADELKKAITETIPAKQNENNKQSVKKILDEGLALMARNDLSAEEVDAYLAKIDAIPEADAFSFPLEVNAGTVSDYNLSAYGWNFDATNIIWGNVKENNADTMWLPAYRFTMRAKGDQKMAQLKFAQDTYNKPVAFNGEGYVFETEFSILYKSNGYIALGLNGVMPDGTEKTIAQLRFAPSSDTQYKKSGRAYFTDAKGAKIGNDRIVKMATDDEKNAGQLFFLRVNVDLVNQRYTAWLMPRKTGTGAYNASEPTDADLLIDNQPLNADGIAAFTGMTYSITQSNATNGIWVHNYKADEYVPEPLPETAVITVDEASLTAGGTASASVTVTKPTAGEKSYTAYAVVMKDNVLQYAAPYIVTIADGKTTGAAEMQIAVPDDTQAVVKFFVWTADQTPLCPASVNTVK